jgi:hypothetical protein
MTDEVTLHLSARARNRASGKIIVTLVSGVLLGLLYHNSTVADYVRAQQLTLARYTEDFEAYKARLTEHFWPLWGDVLLVLLMVFVFFGVYELLSFGVAWIIEKIQQPTPGDH